MRVAIDARSLSEQYTSNRTYWAELVTALGRWPELELLLISNAPLPPEAIPVNAQVYVEPSGGRWFSLKVLPMMARQLKADVVHLQYTISPLFRMPVVTMVHDVSFFIEPSWFGRKDRFLLRSTVPAACRRAARVVVPSESCRRELLHYISVPEEKVIATPLGVPSDLIQMDPTHGESVLKELTQGNPYVLLVGGGSPRKNLQGALAAVAMARETVPNLLFLITGRLGDHSFEPWVITPGAVAEEVLAAAYRGAHALLHPSYHEGFGLTVLEAMAMGCPVVASDRGAIPEVASDAAILCDPNDAVGMATALVRLFDSEVRRVQMEKGKARSNAFRWERTAELTMLAYREAIQVS